MKYKMLFDWIDVGDNKTFNSRSSVHSDLRKRLQLAFIFQMGQAPNAKRKNRGIVYPAACNPHLFPGS